MTNYIIVIKNHHILIPHSKYNISQFDTIFLKDISNKNMVARTLMKFIWKYFDKSRCSEEFQNFLFNYCSDGVINLINPTLPESDEYKIFDMFFPIVEIPETNDEYISEYYTFHHNLILLNETSFIDDIKITKYYKET